MAKQFSIEAVFKAIDKFSKPLKGMNKNTSQFSRALRTDFAKAQRRVKQFSVSVKQNIGRVVKGALVGAVVAIGAGITKMIQEASKIEDITAAFTPMMGGAQEAEKLVSALNDTAASTPFQLGDISKATQQLLPAMNRDIGKTVKTFRMLGDTAGGSAEKLNTISAVYSRAMLKNKVETGDLNILTERGIPIYNELSKSMGISVAEMSKMAAQGKITGQDLTNAFEAMTSEGGVFFQGMEIASKTLTGKISTLKDNIALTGATIGKNLLPIIKPLVDRAIEIAGAVRKWAEQNRSLINVKINNFIKKTVDVVKTAITVFSTLWKIIKPFLPLIIAIVAALLAYEAVMFASAAALNVFTAATKLARGFQFLYVAGTKGMTAAQAQFNGVAMANPIALIIAAIAALIAILTIAIVKYEEYGAAILGVMAATNPLMAGLYVLIGIFREVYTNWEAITASFRRGGFINGMKTLGAVILNAVLRPIQQLLVLLEKIPGVAKLGLSGKVGDLMGQNESFINRDTDASQMVESKQALYAPTVTETRSESVSRGELTIKDQTGRAEMTKNPSSGAFNVALAQSGDF